MPASAKMLLGALNFIECISETLFILLRAHGGEHEQFHLESFHCQSSDCYEETKRSLLPQELDNDKPLDSKDKQLVTEQAHPELEEQMAL